jgi:hypothetical protein
MARTVSPLALAVGGLTSAGVYAATDSVAAAIVVGVVAWIVAIAVFESSLRRAMR